MHSDLWLCSREPRWSHVPQGPFFLWSLFFVIDGESRMTKLLFYCSFLTGKTSFWYAFYVFLDVYIVEYWFKATARVSLAISQVRTYIFMPSWRYPSKQSKRQRLTSHLLTYESSCPMANLLFAAAQILEWSKMHLIVGLLRSPVFCTSNYVRVPFACFYGPNCT